MNQSPFDRFLTHPKRGWAVTTATLVAGLIFLLPAVDSFRAAGLRHRELQAQLDEATTQVGNLTRWETRRQQETEALAKLASQRFPEEKIDAFRAQMVDLVHRTECTMRRIRLSDPKYRDWMKEGDDPRLDHPPAGAEEPTPYFLQTRQLSLSAEGTLDRVQQLLEELQKTEGLVHSTSVSIRRSETKPQEVALDLELEFFDLVRKADVEI